MRFFVIFAFIACLIAVGLSQEGADSCSLACPRSYVPVCAKRMVNGKLEENEFAHECLMRNANECESGNWVQVDCPPQPGQGDLKPVPY